MKTNTTKGSLIPQADRVDLERRAAIWEDSVVSIWESRLIPPLAAAIALPEEGSVLVAECRTGLLPILLAERLNPDVRIVALDPSREMLDIARAKLEAVTSAVWLEARGTEQLTYSESVFKASFCAAGILTKDDVNRIASELTRITVSGGPIGLVVPLRDTFVEFYDLFREALIALDLGSLESQLEAFVDDLFDEEALRVDLVAAGVKDAEIHRVRFEVPFNSGQDFLLSPLVESLYLPYWMLICREDEVREQIFFRVLQAMDRYFWGLGINLTAEAAWVLGAAQ
jgi:ubiquinone/menaquinone biosynthesis C-methylase UbiE